ncbi:MAG: type II secretion system inner membrane protein GspF [Cellvibrionaceae bacterium]
MPAFEYKALNTAGNQQKGLMEGDSERQIRQKLRDQGLLPTEVVAVSESGNSGAKPSLAGIFQDLLKGSQKLKTSALALITRQLSTLLSAGTPLEAALQSVARQGKQKLQSRILLAVRSKVLEGHSLAAGLGEFPNTFSQLYRATVAAGEQAGKLDQVLIRLADYLEARQAIQQKTGLALIYPLVLSFVAIGVLAALLTFVVPKVVQVFESTGQELPGLTIAMIAASDFLQDYGLLVLILLIAAGIGFKWLLTKPQWLQRWHRLQLNIPVVKGLVQGMETARFTRTMSILLGSGVAALEALKIAQQVVNNTIMSKAIDSTSQRVREGSGIGQALAETELFPPMTLELINNGESSGRLPEMMERAAMSQEQELETTTATALGLFEPLIILVMGGMVMLIVLAILMPIFEMNQLAG